MDLFRGSKAALFRGVIFVGGAMSFVVLSDAVIPNVIFKLVPFTIGAGISSVVGIFDDHHYRSTGVLHADLYYVVVSAIYYSIGAVLIECLCARRRVVGWTAGGGLHLLLTVALLLYATTDSW